MNLLQELLNQATDIDLGKIELPNEDKDEPQANEKVLGTMSDDAKRLWALRDQIANEMDPLIKEIEPLDKDSDRYQELDEQLSVLQIRKSVVSTLMSATVNLEMHQSIGKAHVRVGKDGQIIWRPCRNCDSGANGIGIEVISVSPGGLPSSLADLLFG